MDTTTNAEQAVRGFLAEDVLTPEEARAIDADADLLRTGILNSLTLANLVVFLEERYGMTVAPAEFELETFRTLRSIAVFVERKRGAA